jgi:hypothetical protein
VPKGSLREIIEKFDCPIDRPDNTERACSMTGNSDQFRETAQKRGEDDV